MKKYLFFVFCLIFSISAFNQNVSYKTHSLTLPPPATINVSAISDKWQPMLKHIEMPFPGGDRARLAELKEELSKKYPVKNSSGSSYKNNQQENTGSVPPPSLLRNFEANLQNGGVPMDNDMAISNDGTLISVTNSMIYIFDVNSDSLLKTVLLDTLAKPLNLTGSSNYKYDPKVIYDPIEDRFIVVFLNGYTSDYSKIIVAFSKTNDPLGDWNLYAIPGNPLNNSLWSDYPMITITEHDFFLTINLLKNAQSWQLGFVETVIWQIQKTEGYSGNTLVNNLYSSIQYDGKNIRNLCPVKGGAQILGPNMYFLSNRNIVTDNDSLFLVEINNSLSSGAPVLSAKLAFSPFHYFLPPNAKQSTGVLQTNDSRVLGAFLHDDKIQFVQNTLDTSTGRSSIYHGIMSNLSGTPQVSAHIISDTLLYLGYPNISYCGSNITYTGLGKPENDAIITFNHSAQTVFPGVSAAYYDGNGNYSNIFSIKNGDGYINFLLGSAERWGDYSGSQRKYNEPGKVWFSGTFGQSNHKYATWVTELETPGMHKSAPEASNVTLFPNPSQDIVSVNFNLESDKYLKFSVYDTRGRLIIRLTEAEAKSGQNIFSFSALPLIPQIYFLIIEADDEIIAKEKFIKN